MFSNITKKERFCSFKKIILQKTLSMLNKSSWTLKGKKNINYTYRWSTYETVNLINSNSNIIVIVIFETDLIVVVVVLLSFYSDNTYNNKIGF